MTPPPVERRRPLQNRLLRSLAGQEYERLVPHLELVALQRGQVLHRSPAPIDHVYFPMRGVCGLVAATAGGHPIDIGPVGCEGVTGIYTLAGSWPSMQLIVQVGPAQAQRLSFDRFEDEMNRRGTLEGLVTGYYQAFFSEVIESAGCHRTHTARQRYSRRLLAIADRMASDAFFLTHDLMASMLGTQRAAVTGVASSFKDDGAIEYRRGRVTMLDRPAIERSACACYQTARQRIAHLLPPRPSGVR